MGIELLTGLSPIEARKLVDDALAEEAAQLIRECHDDANSDARVACGGYACIWPPLPLKKLSEIAAKCTYLQQKGRVAVTRILPELEELVAVAAS
jgi:hypothetical protein